MSDSTGVTSVDNTTLVEVIQKLSAFKDVDPDVIESFIDDATAVVKSYGLPDAVLSTAVRLYACHALLMQATNSAFQTETMGPMSRTRFDWSKGNDPYWLEFQQLLDQYGLNRSRGRAWTVD